MELNAAWIDRELGFGREPPETVYKRADENFPSSTADFASREQLDEFLDSLRAENNVLMNRERLRYVGERTGNPGLLVEEMMNENARGEGVPAGQVIPDG